MGGWCGATAADAIAMKTRMRLRSPIGGGVCLAKHNGKKCQKLCQGEVLPLDRSLLMGDFSVPSSQLGVMRVSTLYPVKSICSQ